MEHLNRIAMGYWVDQCQRAERELQAVPLTLKAQIAANM